MSHFFLFLQRGWTSGCRVWYLRGLHRLFLLLLIIQVIQLYAHMSGSGPIWTVKDNQEIGKTVFRSSHFFFIIIIVITVIRCHLLSVICQLSPVTCLMSHVPCHLTPVTFIHFHPFSYTFVPFCPFLSTFILFHALSSFFILFYTLQLAGKLQYFRVAAWL